jgi:hypothetical protein
VARDHEAITSTDGKGLGGRDVERKLEQTSPLRKNGFAGASSCA